MKNRTAILSVSSILVLLFLARSIRYEPPESVQKTFPTIAVTEISTPTATHPPVSGTAPTPASTEIPGEKHMPCPQDPDMWSLKRDQLNSYQPIQPACVYSGLERTVAWMLAMRSGYPWNLAIALLDFEAMPVARLDQGEYVSRFEAEWWLDEEGQVAVSYGLRGCFRVKDPADGQLGTYPVVCLVVEDAANTRTVYLSGGQMNSLRHEPTRSYLLFGYVGAGKWVWLQAEDNPREMLYEPERALRESAALATLYDARFWDAHWLGSYMGLPARPLPEGWQ